MFALDHFAAEPLYDGAFWGNHGYAGYAGYPAAYGVGAPYLAEPYFGGESLYAADVDNFLDHGYGYDAPHLHGDYHGFAHGAYPMDLTYLKGKKKPTKATQAGAVIRGLAGIAGQAVGIARAFGK